MRDQMAQKNLLQKFLTPKFFFQKNIYLYNCFLISAKKSAIPAIFYGPNVIKNAFLASEKQFSKADFWPPMADIGRWWPKPFGA